MRNVNLSFFFDIGLSFSDFIHDFFMASSRSFSRTDSRRFFMKSIHITSIVLSLQSFLYIYPSISLFIIRLVIIIIILIFLWTLILIIRRRLMYNCHIAMSSDWAFLCLTLATIDIITTKIFLTMISKI